MKKLLFLVLIFTIGIFASSSVCEKTHYADGSIGIKLDGMYKQWINLSPSEKESCNHEDARKRLERERNKEYTGYISLALLCLIVLSILTINAKRFRKVSHENIEKIIDEAENKTKAINKFKHLCFTRGYGRYVDDNSRLLLKKYSFFFWHRDTIDISLTKFQKDLRDEALARKAKRTEYKVKKVNDSQTKKPLPKVKIGLFDRFKKKTIDDRVVDEILYEYVLTELEEDIRAKGLWAKAYANSDGDENKIEPLYMQYRVQSIKDAFVSMEIAYNEMSKKMLLEYIKDKLTP